MTMTTTQLIEELRKCPANANVELDGGALRVVNAGGTEVLRQNLPQKEEAKS